MRVLCCAMLALATAQRFEPGVPAFDFAIAKYRSMAEQHAQCDDAGPAEYLASLPLDRAEALARAVWIYRGQTRVAPRDGARVAAAGWPPDVIASAAVLHTRFAYAHSAAATTEQTHLDLARRFVDLLESADPQYPIAPLWYALRAAELQGRAEVFLLVDHVRSIPDRHRTHPLIQLATASMNELLAAPVIAPQIRRRLMGRGASIRVPDAVAAQQRAYRNAAISGYRRALGAEASDAEASIGLAHLLIGDGHFDEAAPLLERASGIAQGVVLQYYAALITGRLHERRGQIPEAERAYRSAAAVAPNAQTPPLALAHVLFRSGRAAEARTAIEAALRPAATRTAEDPWWDYLYGQYWRRSAYVGEMLRMVRRCDS